jgi:hypothetical protein
VNNTNQKVVIAWLLLIPVISYNIRHAFLAYRTDAKLWKLLIHCAALICLGWLIVDLGVFCLHTQFELNMTYKSQFAAPKPGLKRAEAVPKPARAAPAQHKHAQKK